ncbi:MAG: hypothetical protein GY948_17285 [Alphaproteobacteria bacterium]|nr:hypothetical protein [Alphaproteobacteria bacterium]
MLEAAVIAMTVMGCNHQSQDCEIITRPPKVWQSQTACDAAIPKIIEDSMKAPYPVIVARCQAKASKTAETKPQPLKIGTPQPEIQVVELPAPVQAPAQAPAKTEDEPGGTKLPPMAKLALQKTTEGWTFVRKGTTDGIQQISGGVKTGVKRAVGGVKSVVGRAVDLAERGADAVREALTPQD